jgi:protein-disulfide isomerase-like protein with CxxC motif
VPLRKRFWTPPSLRSRPSTSEGPGTTQFRTAITAGNAPRTRTSDGRQAAECITTRPLLESLKLYAEQAGENRGAFLPDRLKQFASDLGLDREEFDACLDSHKHIDLIVEERNQASDAGANGTPSFLIDGELVVGYMTFDEFSRHIEEALAAR